MYAKDSEISAIAKYEASARLLRGAGFSVIANEDGSIQISTEDDGKIVGKIVGQLFSVEEFVAWTHGFNYGRAFQALLANDGLKSKNEKDEAPPKEQDEKKIVTRQVDWQEFEAKVRELKELSDDELLERIRKVPILFEIKRNNAVDDESGDSWVEKQMNIAFEAIAQGLVFHTASRDLDFSLCRKFYVTPNSVFPYTEDPYASNVCDADRHYDREDSIVVRNRIIRLINTEKVNVLSAFREKAAGIIEVSPAHKTWDNANPLRGIAYYDPILGQTIRHGHDVLGTIDEKIAEAKKEIRMTVEQTDDIYETENPKRSEEESL